MEVQLPLPEDRRFNRPVGFSKKSNAASRNEIRSICILRLNSIGEIIHTLPVVDVLKEKFPDARLTWIAEKQMAPLLKHHPGVDQLLLIDSRRWQRGLFSPSVWKEVFLFLQYFRSQEFDVALDFQGIFRTSALARFSGAGRRIGMCRADRHLRWSGFLLNEMNHKTAGKSHRIEKNLAMLESLEIDSANHALNFHIHADEEAVEYVSQELKKLDLQDFILVNPGGGWITKIWELQKFSKLIDSIYNDLNLPALILWGPGEKHMADRIARKCISPAVVSFSTNLSEAIALVAQSRLVVSGDTGPLHVASAMGIPVVGIYGPTDPNLNGPWNPHDSACSINYECSPCHLSVCPIGMQCMKKLDVAPVLDAVKKTFFLSDSLNQNQ